MEVSMKLIKRLILAFIAGTLFFTATPLVHAHTDSGFVHADGTQVIGTDGQPLHIKG